jgi:hypothetical protein
VSQPQLNRSGINKSRQRRTDHQESRLHASLLKPGKTYHPRNTANYDNCVQPHLLHTDLVQPTISYAIYAQKLLVSAPYTTLAQPVLLPDTERRGITMERGPQWNALPPHLYQDLSTGHFNLRSEYKSKASYNQYRSFVLADLEEINQAFEQDANREIYIPSEDLYSEPSREL